jgi:hypothetical protein
LPPQRLNAPGRLSIIYQHAPAIADGTVEVWGSAPNPGWERLAQLDALGEQVAPGADCDCARAQEAAAGRAGRRRLWWSSTLFTERPRYSLSPPRFLVLQLAAARTRD